MDVEEAKVVSRAEAIAAGQIRYFTGAPCKNGHIDFRSVRKWECYGCKQEREMRRLLKRPEHHAARVASKRDRLRSARNARQRERYAETPDEWLRRNAKWRCENPDRHRLVARVRAARYRARKRASTEHYTADDVAQLLRFQRRRCVYCRDKLMSRDYHVDHIVALSKGGDNSKRNIQILCGTCNRRKSARDSIEFAQSMGLLL